MCPRAESFRRSVAHTASDWPAEARPPTLIRASTPRQTCIKRNSGPTGGSTSAKVAALRVVYGPVSLYPQFLTIADADQISFHTEDALKVLTTGAIVSRGNPVY